MICDWDALKHNHTSQLKLPTVTAMPHKSRLCRLTLDLSLVLRVSGAQKSVDGTSTPVTQRDALDSIGTTLQNIIHAIASAATDTTCLFSKADVKDSFWRTLVKKEE